MKNNIRKSVKRWLALALTAIMVFAMATTVMADDTSTTVTIYKSGTSDTTSNVYAAYQVLDFDVSNGVYVNVTVCDPFDSVIQGSYSTVNDWMAAYELDADNQPDSSLMQTLANSLAACVTFGTTTVAASSSNGVITLPSTGYYLLIETEHNDDLSIETRYILVAAEGTAKTVTLKESSTSIKKKIVLEDETSRVGTAVDNASSAETRVDDDVVAIGDTVTYEITATIPSYPEVVKNYINDNAGTSLTFEITDVMSKGLTYGSASVSIGGKSLTLSNDYTINTTGGSGSDTTITIDISTEQVLNNGGETVTVTLTATLNEYASYGETGNPNSVDLTYTNGWDTSGKPDDTDTTPEDTVITYTGQFYIQKTDDDAANPQNLTGAKFKIVTDSSDPDNTVLKFTQESTGVYRYDPEGSVTELEGDSNGKIEIRGMNNGTYYAVETAAPDGYNLDSTPQTITLKAAANTGVTGLENNNLVSESTTATTGSDANTEITNDNKITWTAGTSGTDTVTITNHQGTTLPGTGGIGTTIFTFGGLALVILAAIMFIVYTKKQRKQA